MIGTRGRGPQRREGVRPQCYGNGQPPRRPCVDGVAILPRIADETETSTELSPAGAAERLRAGAQLVDVRQAYEWEAGHIEGAVHIPLEQLPARADELDRERPIVFGCRSGSRSGLATQAFRESGYEAFNLAGGLLAWVEDDKKIEPVDGEVAGPRPDAT